MIATAGSSSASHSADVAVREPWWPTLSTSTGPTRPASRPSTGTPASPANNTLTAPYRTRRTTECSFGSSGVATQRASGLSTSSVTPSTVKRSPDRAGVHGAPLPSTSASHSR
jgi:hypothetical protein